MEIVSIKVYKVGDLHCYACNIELSLTDLKRVELANGNFMFVCEKCCNKLAKVCDITVEEIDKPDVTECAKCLIRFKCFTNRGVE